jgi:hypothetical protein
MLVYTVKFYDTNETQVIATRFVPGITPEDAVMKAQRENPIFVEKASPVEVEEFMIPGYIVEAKPEKESQLYALVDYETIVGLFDGLQTGSIDLVKAKIAEMKANMDSHITPQE